VPVTLKIRTGWSPDRRNGVAVARIAEAAGVSALAVHGRTRACRFEGEAEYATIAAIRESVSIPVFANGDITRAAQAVEVIRATGAAGVMVGRGAQGRPWIFREIDAALAGLPIPPEPSADETRDIITAHLRDLYAFYGEEAGVRIARKHIGWYCRERPHALAFRQSVMRVCTGGEQLAAVREFFALQGRALAA
jgi:tRNA-dihydrouridine synthase B